MKRLIVLTVFLGLSALSLAGCETTKTIEAINGFAITQSQLDAARTSYDGLVLAPLDKYASLPRCPTGVNFTLTKPCHERVALKKIREADKSVDVAIQQTQDQITSGNGTGAVAAYNRLKVAIDLARGLILASGAASL